MTTKTRRQLTLFVDAKDAENIEKIRLKFNPVQNGLIKSHVTLCREDEIENLEKIITNLESLGTKKLIIHFGHVIRFENGKGVLLPAMGEKKVFHDVRKLVLQGLQDNPRRHDPHITLMHPRNSTCTDAIFAEITKIALPTILIFGKISLIEQEEGGPWKTIRQFELQ